MTTAEEAVRAEFSRVPDELCRAGRQKVLRSLLGRDSIFVTARPAAGNSPRANVQRELGGLAAYRAG
jgi:predicted metal-dependent HD superfamily phosphohydrolase